MADLDGPTLILKKAKLKPKTFEKRSSGISGGNFKGAAMSSAFSFS
jgi:hypothetical protein